MLLSGALLALLVTAGCGTGFIAPVPGPLQGSMTASFSGQNGANLIGTAFTATAISGYTTTNGGPLTFTGATGATTQTIGISLLGRIVQGAHYALDPKTFGIINTASLTYSERASEGAALQIWYATSGTITVTSISGSTVDFEFAQVALSATPAGDTTASNAKGSFTLQGKAELVNTSGL